MVSLDSHNQSFDLELSSHITIPNSLGELIFVEGLKSVNY